MKKRLYHKVLKNLQKFFGTRLKGHRLSRLKKLAALICGLIRRKRPDMRSLGSGLLQRIKAHSKEKEAKKFLDNRWIDQETYYHPYISQFIEQLMALFPKRKGITLVIDGSKMGKNYMALMVSLRLEGRGLPLMWLVRKKAKGHFRADVHLELIKKVYQFLHPIVPASKSIKLLGDGEFDSIKLQEFCNSKSWNYVFRTSSNTVFYENNDSFQPKFIAVNVSQNFYAIPDIEFTEKRMKNVHFVLWHDPKYVDPIPLVSNLEEPLDIIQAYTERYSIECMFKDIKSTTFNIHKTRLDSEYAIANLIMLAAFALTLLLKVGIKYKKSRHREYIHRVRNDQKIYSLITYARDFITYCLDEGIDFCFSFQFSKNSS